MIANEVINLCEVLSGPPGKKKKILKQGLTKKAALQFAREQRQKGIPAFVFPDDDNEKKRMVIVWQ